MKNKILSTFLTFSTLLLVLSGCGKELNEIDEFGQKVDNFCSSISKIDNSINSINANSDDAVSKLLGYLDDLNVEFENFATLDFPEEFDYLEPLADEASSYMLEAVTSYHNAYADGFDTNMSDFAQQNYSRAYKRIQIIVTFLHGEEPEDVSITTTTEQN